MNTIDQTCQKSEKAFFNLLRIELETLQVTNNMKIELEAFNGFSVASVFQLLDTRGIKLLDWENLA